MSQSFPRIGAVSVVTEQEEERTQTLDSKGPGGPGACELPPPHLTKHASAFSKGWFDALLGCPSNVGRDQESESS